MPCALTFDPARKLITIVQSGTINNGENAEDSLRAIRAHPKFSSACMFLCDFREAGAERSLIEAHSIGNLLKALFPGQRFAYVISENLVDMVAAQARAAAPLVHIRSFSDIAGAMAWLTESPASFSPGDLEIARQVFDAIVGNEPNRALALAPVIQWPPTAWSAFKDAMRTAGFDVRNPKHLTALQSLIDKACDV
jgi:hypothetical protein